MNENERNEYAGRLARAIAHETHAYDDYDAGARYAELCADLRARIDMAPGAPMLAHLLDALTAHRAECAVCDCKAPH